MVNRIKSEMLTGKYEGSLYSLPHELSYRPVSLAAVLYKLREHVIYKNIMQHLNDNNILLANQHGVRKDHSCETQLLLTVEDLARNINNKTKWTCLSSILVKPLTS